MEEPFRCSTGVQNAFFVSFLQGRAFGYVVLYHGLIVLYKISSSLYHRYRRTGHAIYSFTSDADTGNQIGSKSTITLKGDRYGADRNQRGEFRLLVAPKTAFHIGPNRVRLRGVATVDQLKHSRCVIVGKDKMVEPFRVGAGNYYYSFCQTFIISQMC